MREGVRRLFRLPIGTRAVARSDADAELDAYIATRVEHFVARGMTPHGRPSWTPGIGARASAAGS